MTMYLHNFVAVSFTGALAFGLYFATLLTCLRWLLFTHEGWVLKKDIRWVIVTTTFLILASNVVYLSMSLYGTMLSARHAIEDPPGVSFHGPSWISIVACTAANCNILLADLILVWRCWIVYEKRVYIIAFPSFLWLGAFVCTVLQIYLQVMHIIDANIGPYTWASVNMTFGPGIVLLPFWISTVILNAYSSAVLIRRIYSSVRELGQYAPVEHLNLLIHAIAESGFLYLSVTFAHLLIWFGSSEMAINIIAILNAPIVGIAFNWFLIRLERNKARIATELNGPTVPAMQFGNNSQCVVVDTIFCTATTDTTLPHT